MAEKWDGSANDSPEVVYEGFSPPPTHHQGMINAAGSSFVAADGNEDVSLVGSAAAFIQPIVENQGEGSHHEEIERSRLCFVCCNPVSDKNYESIKASMNHSHAPLLVLLTDVLGYKLEEGRLHSQVVCKACYHLLDIIDELQQTLTESKTDVRTKFLETIQKLRLKYPRTDKMLKPRCLRCIQMSQSTARKRGRGRGWKGRSDDVSRCRGRGRGRGRSASRSEDGNDVGSDTEGQEVCGEVSLPSKSSQLQSCEMNGVVRDMRGCPLDSSVGFGKAVDSCDRNFDPEKHDMLDSLDSMYKQTLSLWIGEVSPFECVLGGGEDPANLQCDDCSHLQYECYLCKGRNSRVFYQYCETCMTCHGTFVPWGCNISLEFIDEKCSVCDLKIHSQLTQGKMQLVSQGIKLTKDLKTEILGNESHIHSVYKKDNWNIEEASSAAISELDEVVQENTGLNESDRDLAHNFSNYEVSRPTAEGKAGNMADKAGEMMCVEDIVHEQTGKGSLFTEKVDGNSTVADIMSNRKTLYSDLKDDNGTTLKTDMFQSAVGPDIPDDNLTGTESITCLTGKDLHNDFDDSYMVVSEALSVGQDSCGVMPKNFVSNYLCYKEIQGLKYTEAEASERRLRTSEPNKANGQELQDQSETASVISHDKKTLADLFTEISSQPSIGKRKRKLTEKARELIEEGVEALSVDKKMRKNIRVAKVAETADSRDAKKFRDGVYDCKYMCEYCGKKFNSSGGFRYHVDSHEIDKAKIYACSYCIYTTRRQADLRKHNVIHTGEKHYKCEICGQEFSVNSSYNRHLRIHSGEKPYKCSVCGKDFQNSGTLKQHMVKHTGARNFVCEVCGSSFSLRHHYTAHRKLHNGEMPFKCLFCRSAFRNHSALKCHRKKNHPKEEANRLRQMKLKRTIVREDLGVQSSPGVIQGSVDVLEQAMAAAVDPVTYEYVDSYTQTLPGTDELSSPLVSEIITENFPGKDSVVLAVSHIEDRAMSEETTISSNCLSMQNDTPVVELQESETAFVSLDCQEQDKIHQTMKVYPGSFCPEDAVSLSQEYVMLKDDHQPIQSLKPESVEVMDSSRSDASQMYIMLSDTQAQDSHLYIVVKNDGEAS